MIHAALLCALLLAVSTAEALDSNLMDGGNDRRLLIHGIPIVHPSDMELTKPGVDLLQTLPRLCPLGKRDSREIRVDDISDISEKFCSEGNPSSNVYGLTNMVWAFGQFIDHDIVATVEKKDESAIVLPGAQGREMHLHRVLTVGRKQRPPSAHNGRVNGGAVYGENKLYEEEVLREPNSCRLRESVKGFLPVETTPDANGISSFIAGDGRANEHAILTTMHTLWVREHNRLCAKLDGSSVHGRRSHNWKYKRAKSTVIAKIQQVAVNEWLPAFKIRKQMLQNSEGMVDNSKISVEFSVGFRLGHTMIPDRVAGMTIGDIFNGQKFFLNQDGTNVEVKADAEHKMGLLLTGLATEPCAEMDGRMSDSLRLMLFGPHFQQDLAARNIFRGRDLNLPTYAGLAKCFGVEPDARTERETPDAWIGLLREPRSGRQPLGPTHKRMMIEQFGRIFFGKRGLWWENNQGMYKRVKVFEAEVKGNNVMAKVIRDNFGLNVRGNVFKLESSAYDL